LHLGFISLFWYVEGAAASLGAAEHESLVRGPCPVWGL
jgi:hypothetical protein